MFPCNMRHRGPAPATGEDVSVSSLRTEADIAYLTKVEDSLRNFLFGYLAEMCVFHKRMIQLGQTRFEHFLHLIQIILEHEKTKGQEAVLDEGKIPNACCM